jgi:hypothetical protein
MTNSRRLASAHFSSQPPSDSSPIRNIKRFISPSCGSNGRFELALGGCAAYSWAMNVTRPISLTLLFFGLLSSVFAQYTPTISGVNAFWWLGNGILSDGAGCSYGGTPCYYAQSQLTANPNGAPGTPSWTVVNHWPYGSVSLSCYTCTNPVATATSPSDGCIANVQIYVAYGPYQSTAFNVTIVTPNTTTLQSGYPKDTAQGIGYDSITRWNLTDSCGYSDPGLDGNEVIGTRTNDYSGNSWGNPSPVSTYNSSSLWNDTVGASGQLTPPSTTPQTPLLGTKVFHDYPWTLNVGTQSYAFGTPVRRDTQQWYVDHGRHE